jgi:3-dehydroquinate synthase
MNQQLICAIRPSASSYAIDIDNGILSSKTRIVETLRNFSSTFAVITDDIVAELYGKQLCQALSSAHLNAHLFSFPSGEQHKTRATKEALEDQLFEKGFGSDICVIGLGGGVVTDLAGYLAATYCRGVPFVTIPTTLLGMVDASIGGKGGVNVPCGKNMLGCIYQPNKVIIDPSSLQTLSKKELRNGAVEMIKHGLIADEQYFEFLENNVEQLLALDSTPLKRAIFESCRIKKEIVEHDVRGQGKRHLLNFGHTVGHALEHLTDYSLPHGEAVAIGMLVEGHLAMQLEHIDLDSFDRIRKILISYGLPLHLPCQYPIQAILNTMASDKKSLNGEPRFVLLDKIGSCSTYGSHYCVHVSKSLLNNALQWMLNALCHH